VRLAIREQEDAGLAIVTDGELRRRHYIWGFLDGLTGVDTERLAQQRSRGGRYSEPPKWRASSERWSVRDRCFSTRAASRAI
jgi:5-methyltetrahydropteroyltriglutamate--homocysteine methyltransferase